MSASHSISRSQTCQNGVGVLAGDEGEVDLLDAVAEHEVDEQVAEDQDDQHEAGGPHVDPAPLLPVHAALRRGAGGGAGSVDGRHDQLDLREDVDELHRDEAGHQDRPRGR